MALLWVTPPKRAPGFWNTVTVSPTRVISARASVLSLLRDRVGQRRVGTGRDLLTSRRSSRDCGIKMSKNLKPTCIWQRWRVKRSRRVNRSESE
jgi:hypothetical protein